MSSSSSPLSAQQNRARLAFLIGLIAFFVVLSVWTTFKARSHRSAFARWQPQLLEMEQGENIAERHNYPNPPIMGLILLPLAKLPTVWGSLAWFYLKVVLTLLAIVWLFRMIGTAERPFPGWAQAVVVLLALRPIMGDLQHGNVNLFILFLVVAALAAYSVRWDVTAGLTLGLAIACKVTPALFVPYFLWKRAWRVLAGCVGGLVLFLWPGIVPGIALGWEDNREQLASWYKVMVQPFVIDGKVTSEHNNQSLPGLATRLLTHSPSFSVYINDVYTPTDYDNVADLSPAVVRWLVKGCMGLFVLLVVWTCRTPTGERRGWRLAAEYSLIVLGMLLFSERTWKHHCVTLLLPFGVLCYYLAACRPTPALRRGLIACLVAVTLLIAATSTSLLPSPAAKQAQVYGAYVWAFLLLIAALVVVLRQPEAMPSTPTEVR
jgi:alpha-1,2-mannosyltransferase